MSEVVKFCRMRRSTLQPATIDEFAAMLAAAMRNAACRRDRQALRDIAREIVGLAMRCEVEQGNGPGAA